jgi:spore coat polysaccharide biosynthesis predicted glycosyltransferase SpsG
MKIFIRAYGSHLMGMGHLYRVKKIVNRLRDKKKYTITLFTQRYSESINIYKDIDVDKFIEIEPNIAIDNEIAILERVLNKNYDICINDQLNSSREVAKVLTKNIKTTITFDDLGQGSYLFNYIINILYPSQERLLNEINAYEYMILNNYTSIKDSIKFQKNIKKIFINQGAADTWGAIPDIIRDLNRINLDIVIKVLLGPSYQHFDELALVLKENDKRVEIFNFTDNVLELVKDCDLAILGAGNTLFEVASLGIPIIASTREDKELITIQRLLDDNIVYSENKIYTDSIDRIVNRVIEDSDGRFEKFELNRNLFQYSGLEKILELINGV